jgi:hypothetical protein
VAFSWQTGQSQSNKIIEKNHWNPLHITDGQTWRSGNSL